MNAAFVIMYHRVCERSERTEPWFARGTAVTPEAFARQVQWLAERFMFVEAADILQSRAQPAVAVSFDDGYADVLEHAVPVCEQFGVKPACFAAAGPAVQGRPLWFDAWYATASVVNPAVEAWFELNNQTVPRTPAEWASGTAKAWLARQGPRRDRLVQDLVERRRAEAPAYLRLDDLRYLASHGWTIGGHGLDHHRLADVDDDTVRRELDASVDLLDRLGAVGARVFAYPDGAHDERVSTLVRGAGFDVAFTVEAAGVNIATMPLAVPRLFARGNGEVPHPLLGGFS